MGKDRDSKRINGVMRELEQRNEHVVPVEDHAVFINANNVVETDLLAEKPVFSPLLEEAANVDVVMSNINTYKRPIITGPRIITSEIGIDRCDKRTILANFSVDYRNGERAKPMDIFFPLGIDYNECGQYRFIVSAYSTEHEEAVGYFESKLIIHDTLPPIVEMIKEEDTIEINSKVLGDIKIEDYMTATDNSGQVFMNWDLNKVLHIDKTGRYTVTAVISDKSENEVVRSVHFTVVDTIAPVIKLFKKDIYHEFNSGNRLDTNISKYAEATDNSGRCSLTWNFDNVVDFTQLGTYTVTFTAVDASNNKTTKKMNVHVVDTTAPTIQVLKTREVVEINTKSGDEFDIATYVKATDNSGVVTLAMDMSGVKFDTVGSYQVPITAVDPSGNMSETIILFEVEDTRPPVLDILKPTMTVELGVLNASDFSVKDFAQASDNGRLESLRWNIDKAVDFKSVGKYKVEVVAKDTGKNKTIGHVEFDVVDTTPPTIEFLKEDPNVTIEVDVTKEIKPSHYDVHKFVKATDNAGKPLIGWDLATAVDFTSVGAYPVTITATDASGNESKESVLFSVVDTIAPKLTILRAKEIVEINEKTIEDYNISFFVAASDNSGKYELSWDINNVHFNKVGLYVVPVYAVDGSGNTTEDFITFEVRDTIAPVLKLNHKTYTYEINSITAKEVQMDYFVHATDNSNYVDLSWNIKDVKFNKCGEYRVDVIAKDKVGNTTKDMMMFNIVDTIAPELTILKEKVVVEINSVKTSAFMLKEYATATDNSGKVRLDWNIERVNFGRLGSYEVTVVAVDGSRNQTTGTIMFEIVDTTAPELVLSKTTDTIEVNSRSLAAMTVYHYATAKDNSGEVKLSWNLSALDLTKVGKYTVDVTAVDPSGNETIKHIKFNIVDTTPPTLNILKPSDIYEVNTMNIEDFAIKNYASATDNSGECTLEWKIRDVKFNKVGTYEIDVIAKDQSGNKTVKQIRFSIVDTQAPVIEVFRSIGTIEVNEYKNSDFKVSDFADITDNSGKFTATWDIKNANLKKVGQYPITIVAKDASGNIATKQVKINVVDTIPPVIKVKKEKLSFEVGERPRSTFFDDSIAVITDNSGEVQSTLVFNEVNFHRVGEYPSEIVAVDPTGNRTTKRITVCIVDTTPPNIILKRYTETVPVGKKSASSYSVGDFAMATDNSGHAILDWNLRDKVDFRKKGKYSVTIVAKDRSGNESSTKVTFNVI